MEEGFPKTVGTISFTLPLVSNPPLSLSQGECAGSDTDCYAAFIVRAANGWKSWADVIVFGIELNVVVYSGLHSFRRPTSLQKLPNRPVLLARLDRLTSRAHP